VFRRRLPWGYPQSLSRKLHLEVGRSHFSRPIPSLDSSVRIATRLWSRLSRYRGSIPDRAKRSFSSLQRSDRLCGPPSIISHGYRGVKLAIRLRLLSRLRMNGSIPPLTHKSSWHSA
jgi:hypothetical protein